MALALVLFYTFPIPCVIMARLLNDDELMKAKNKLQLMMTLEVKQTKTRGGTTIYNLSTI